MSCGPWLTNAYKWTLCLAKLRALAVHAREAFYIYIFRKILFTRRLDSLNMMLRKGKRSLYFAPLVVYTEMLGELHGTVILCQMWKGMVLARKLDLYLVQALWT